MNHEPRTLHSIPIHSTSGIPEFEIIFNCIINLITINVRLIKPYTYLHCTRTQHDCDVCYVAHNPCPFTSHHSMDFGMSQDACVSPIGRECTMSPSLGWCFYFSWMIVNYEKPSHRIQSDDIYAHKHLCSTSAQTTNSCPTLWTIMDVRCICTSAMVPYQPIQTSDKSNLN